MDIPELLTRGGYIIFNKIIANKLGRNVAIYLGELCSESVYWENNNKLENDYFYSTMKNVYKNTGLSRFQQDKCRNILLEERIIEIKKRRKQYNLLQN